MASSPLLAAVLVATLLQLAQANLALEPFNFEDINNNTCPGWLAEYVQFHRDNLGKPEAKYLIYTCERRFECGGVGDRLRGIKFTLKLAYLSRRVLLIHDHRAVQLETVLMPNVIDWRPNSVTVNKSSFALLKHGAIDRVGNTLETDVDELIYSDKRFIAYYTNLPGDVVVRNATRPMLQTDPAGTAALTYDPNGVTTEQRRRASCLLRTLFRPHPDLVQEYKAHLRRLFNGSESERYVAIHFRAGGMRGTESGVLQRVHDHLSALVRSVACAQRTAEAFNITAPILLLADNTALRTSVLQGRLGTNVVTTDFQAVHVDYFSGVEQDRVKKQLLNIYVDLLLLSGAQFLVSPTLSGFNIQAALWGAPGGFFGHVHKCLDMPMHGAVKTMFRLPLSWP